MKTKTIGLILVIAAIILAVILISFTIQLQGYAAASCPCVLGGQECAMQGYLGSHILAFYLC